jgi:hypothetical protein
MDRLALDRDPFIAEHRRCGDLDSGLTSSDPERVW